jgi:hypothetical protein
MVGVYSDSPQLLEPSPNYGGSFLLNTIQALQQQDQAAEGPREELRQYLKSGTEPTTDVIGWWGVRVFFFRSNIWLTHRIRITLDIQR